MANPKPSTRVAILTSDSISASGLHTLLSDQDGIEAVVALDTEQSADLAVFDVDVLLADLGWSSDTGALRDHTTLLPEQGRIDGLPTVALVSDESHAAAAWRAGYRSLLLRSESPRALASALCSAAQGLVTLSARLLTSLPVGAWTTAAEDLEDLTDREQQVLELIAEGLTNRAIAQRLSISEHTVKFHVNSILGKLSAESRTDAVVRATRAGRLRL
jgi:two-component system nitrate/nitrite response regulator NarL